MSLATLRPKGQLTIPAQILQQLNIQAYEQVEINLQNGVITIIPANRKESTRKKSLKAFAGVGQGCWGDTSAALKESVDNLRDSWTR